MDRLDPKHDGSSLDIVAENLSAMRALFPEVFTEDHVDFDALRDVLGDYVEDRQERYSFSWHGKAAARRIAQTPSTGTLLPMVDASLDWDVSRNLFLEGDNLEVLKLLQKSYYGRVKMIYIDPPYNTGNDFIYPDRFEDNLSTYLRYTGQVTDEGLKVSTNTESSGRFHTNWLNMMFPRLRLARNLLCDQGVIFISIDDSEVANLRKMCDEVFGEENFVAHITWQRAYSPVNLKKTFSPNHDFILCYAKSMDCVDIKGLKRSDDANARYSNPDNDPRGPWKSSDLSVGPATPEKIYEITTPSGRKVMPPHGYCWRLTRERFDEFVADNRIWFGPNGTAVPSIKRFLSEVKDRVTPMTLWPREEVGDSQEATRELKAIFDGKAYMDYPKPVRLMKRLLELTTGDNDLVLDFFAGSATTGHAMLELNAEDGANRRFIMVQLPEPLDPKSDAWAEGYRTIADIGRERLRRVAKSLRSDGATGDLGFRAFSLSSSNIAEWDASSDDLERDLLNSVDNMKADRSESDLFYELLLKYGLGLSVDVDTVELAGSSAFVTAGGGLVAVTGDEVAEQIADALVSLRDEAKPEVMRVVFRDGAFADDVAKTNIVQRLRSAGIHDVKCV